MHRAVRALLEGKTFSPTKTADSRFHMKAGWNSEEAKEGMPVNKERAAAELAIARWTGNLLERTYPGHPWHVETTIGRNGMGGLIKIRINGIMPGNYWNVVQLADTLTDPGGKRTVLRAAGELLERYKLPRANFDADNFRAAIRAMPLLERTTGRGHVAPLID